MEQEIRIGVSPARGRLSTSTSLVLNTGVSAAACKAMAPPIFRGLNFHELRDLQQGCKASFDAADERETRKRIITAASYLRDLPCRKGVDVRARRLLSLCLKKAEQKEGQSARAFTSYIEELGEDIPDEMSREE
jgi:hypothetical protein